jgi:hypothetical protein
MKKLLLTLVLFLSVVTFAQADGSLGGAVQPSLSCYKNSCQVRQVN